MSSPGGSVQLYSKLLTQWNPGSSTDYKYYPSRFPQIYGDDYTFFYIVFGSVYDNVYYEPTSGYPAFRNQKWNNDVKCIILCIIIQ